MSKNAKQEIGRRSLVKGAAWSVPVLAAAVAAPLAAATGNRASIEIHGDCLLNAANVRVGQGFFVCNHGQAASGQVIVTETITLSGAIAGNGVLARIARAAVWTALAVQGILGGSSSGVDRGSWSGSSTSTTRSRTVTITDVAPNQCQSWGVKLNAVSAVLSALDAFGLGGLAQTGTIVTTQPGVVVTRATDTLNWELLSTSC
ncbi:MAG: hypothetical protein ACK5LO_10735 [Leucobacter sp.]